MIDNISLYKTFVAVADCKSISGVARQMYVSQPAVSTEILSLESKLSVKLFFRTNKGMALTPEGELLYEYAKNALSYLESGEDKLREVTGLRSGVLRIGASDMTLRFFLLDYIERFRESYPDVRLAVTNAPTPRTLEALRSGQIDFAVITEPAEGREDDLELIPVHEIHDIFVATERFAVAAEKKVPLSRLRDFPVMMLSGRTSTREYVKNVLGDGFPEPDIELATSDLLLEFALRSIGIASIVEEFAAGAIASGRLRKLDLARDIPPRRFLLAYQKKLPLGAAAKEMIRTIQTDIEDKKL